MSVNVPVIPYPANLLYDEQDLYRFLLTCQEQSLGGDEGQIVSFSQKIDLIDPLAVLQAIAQPNQIHFYWENPCRNEAIFGYGITQLLTLDSPQRFRESQEFIENCRRKTIRLGDTSVNTPHIFCSFTFFDSSINQLKPFPSATIFLPQFEIFQRNNECFLSINLAINSKVNVHLLIDKIKQQIKTLKWSKRKTIEQSEGLTINNLKSISLETVHDFKSAVISALKSIHNHQFSKLVLAHALDVIAPLNFNIIDSLSYLRKCYPDCCIFSISNGEAKHFIGASPERLISLQERQLVTDALAGSYPRGKTLQQDQKFANKLLTSEKERREHQAVIDFLTQRLYQLGLNPQQSPIKLLQLSNIQHLWTPIYAKIPKHIHPLEIVAKLHPTPAVAGVPTEIACEQIRQYETFDRSLYASPLGWIDAQGNSEFIVGIRSALIEGNKARLYAGAGIVAGSDPEQELAEIQLKFQALLKSLIVNS